MQRDSLPLGILGTNYVPSVEECSVIRNVLIPHHTERSLALANKVVRATAALAALELEYREQHTLLGSHRALLTPMRRLIPDVLLEIFRHCHSDSRNAPMRLAMVCRKWRELALSTPTLWTIVTLHGALPTQTIVPFARACAKYSGSSPIQVIAKFMNRRPDMQFVRRALFEALEILARYVDRWQTFELQLYKAYMPSSGDFRLPNTAPLLEKLVLDVPTSLPFSSLRDLRDLRLLMIQAQDIPLLLQCTLLRNLNIGGSSSELTLMDCWTILSNCQAIEKFAIACINPDFTFLPKRQIDLPNLQELRIGPSTPDPAPLVHCMNASALKRLHLFGKGLDFDSSCITRLVQECRPPLTDLSLVAADGVYVATCLPFLPDLTSLILQNSSALDIVIRRLTERDHEGRFHCPALLHLGLRLCLFKGEHVVEFARERQRAGGGLRVLMGEKPRYRRSDFAGMTIELNLIEGFSDAELQDLYGLQRPGDT